MSLFSTLAHEGALPTRVFSRRGLVTILGAALLVISSVFVVTNSTDEAPVAADTATASLTQGEFFQLNTTALDALVSAAATESLMDVDPFLYWNTAALDVVVPAVVIESQMDADPFLYWNTTALDYPRAPYTEPENGPR